MTLFEQFENTLLDPLLQKLNSFGIKVDAEAIKKAVSNSPQIIQQIESILASSDSKDKFEKIKALINQAVQGQGGQAGGQAGQGKNQNPTGPK